MLCLSIAWSPKLLKLQVKNEDRMVEDDADNAKEVRDGVVDRILGPKVKQTKGKSLLRLA